MNKHGNEKTCLKHYKDKGEWVPFSLPVRYEAKWRWYYAKIASIHPNNPYPNYYDYLDFLKIIDNE